MIIYQSGHQLSSGRNQCAFWAQKPTHSFLILPPSPHVSADPKTISMSFYKLSNRFEVILRCAQNVTLLSKQHHVTLQQPRVTLQKPRVTLQKPRVPLQKPRATLQTPHYTNYTTPQLQLHYNYNYSCTTPHHTTQLWVRWPTRWPLQPLHWWITQLQAPFGPSVPPPCAVLLVWLSDY